MSDSDPVTFVESAGLTPEQTAAILANGSRLIGQ
jgi:hypothetical protein